MRCLYLSLSVAVAVVAIYLPPAEARTMEYRNENWTNEDWAAADVCFHKRYGCQERCLALQACSKNCNDGFTVCVITESITFLFTVTKEGIKPRGPWDILLGLLTTPRATCKDKLFLCNRRCPYAKCMRNCSENVDRCLLLIERRV
ncbi:hypothetical protein ScPMuIL_017311 [Solemya velum]